MKKNETKTEATKEPVAPVVNADATKKEVAPEVKETPKPKTIDELRAEAKAATLASVSENTELSDEERLSLVMAAYKANKAVIDSVNAAKLEEKQKEIETAKNARTQEIDKLLELFTANNDAANNDSLSIDEKNVITNQFKDHLQHVKDEYIKGMAKGTLVIPQGMSGKTLAKAVANGAPVAKDGQNISAEIRAMLDAGKTVDEIEAAGYLRKRVSDVKWGWEKAKGLR